LTLTKPFLYIRVSNPDHPGLKSANPDQKLADFRHDPAFPGLIAILGVLRMADFATLATCDRRFAGGWPAVDASGLAAIATSVAVACRLEFCCPVDKQTRKSRKPGLASLSAALGIRVSMSPEKPKPGNPDRNALHVAALRHAVSGWRHA
jgi:hypothetical protein